MTFSCTSAGSAPRRGCGSDLAVSPGCCAGWHPAPFSSIIPYQFSFRCVFSVTGESVESIRESSLFCSDTFFQTLILTVPEIAKPEQGRTKQNAADRKRPDGKAYKYDLPKHLVQNRTDPIEHYNIKKQISRIF